MSDASKTSEVSGQQPDPVELLQTLQNFNKDQEKYNHLRTLFIEEADVDEYINFLDMDEDIDLTKKQIKEYCNIDDDAKNLLYKAMEKLNLSTRAYDRILKVARTIADLELSEKIEISHLSEAIQYRSLDRKLWLY